jgi:hypothetical protein
MISILTVSCVLFAGLPGSSGSTGMEGDLEKTLAMIPESALALGIVPRLDRLNNDMAEMLDAMNRPSTVLAGRPIEMLKAQMGISVGLDERGSLAAWLQSATEKESKEPSTAFLVPVSDAESFLTGNFTASGEAWLRPDGALMYARSLESHVLLSSDQSLVAGYEPGAGSRLRMMRDLGDKVTTLIAQGDVIAWVDGQSMAGLNTDSMPFSETDVPGLPNFTAEGIRDSVMVIDVDPLGLSLRTFSMFDEASKLGALMVPGTRGPASMSRLSDNPFYFAISVDALGLGGMPVAKALLSAIDLELPLIPEMIDAVGKDLQGMQMAIYPSRLGIALGGLLNDSALIMISEDPVALEVTMRDQMMSLAGDRNGIRYEPEWTEDKELRTGGTADAYRLKETILPPSKSSNGSRPQMGAAFQQIFLQLLYGSRGLNGFAGVESDAMVMTFSQRPDVWGRALQAADSKGDLLSENSTLSAMRPWLLDSPDVEILVGIGSFGKLLKQLSRAMPISVFDAADLPVFPEGLPPIAIDITTGSASVESATVVPTGVLALVYDQAVKWMTSQISTGTDARP